MRTRTRAVGVVVGVALAASLTVTPTAAAVPPAATSTVPTSFAGVPDRTALVLSCGGERVATANAGEARTGLSEVKLFIVDYALRRGDGSAGDRTLAQAMIEASDDADASILDDKYPGAIDAIADEYGLSATSRGSFWGDSYTSAADLVTFLDGLRLRHPDSPILGWMAAASPVASDGTVQNWGTSQLRGVQGTKFGWADDISSAVASASYGPGFTVAAITYGGPSVQNADVEGALGAVDLTTAAAPTAAVPPATLPDIVAELFGR